MLIALVPLPDSLFGGKTPVALGPVKQRVDHLQHQRRWTGREQREVETLVPVRPLIVEHQHAASQLLLDQI
ncbi:hypothetical protein D3C87_1786110 [compost metagenome]